MRYFVPMLLLSLAACGPTRGSECDQKMNDCLRRCELTDSPVEREMTEDPAYDDDSRTLCEQECDDACRE